MNLRPAQMTSTICCLYWGVFVCVSSDIVLSNIHLNCVVESFHRLMSRWQVLQTVCLPHPSPDRTVRCGLVGEGGTLVAVPAESSQIDAWRKNSFIFVVKVFSYIFVLLLLFPSGGLSRNSMCYSILVSEGSVVVIRLHASCCRGGERERWWEERHCARTAKSVSRTSTVTKAMNILWAQ
jgi:hypothetical protein